MGFNTEFAFSLPRGFTDPQGRLHRDGAMRLATAADEIAPLQDFRVRSNRAYLVVLLLSRVVTRLGALVGDEITPTLIEQLFSADVAYLQNLYRQINETGTPHLEANCPACGARLQVDLGSRAVETIAS